jgi:hypothetical protein
MNWRRWLCSPLALGPSKVVVAFDIEDSLILVATCVRSNLSFSVLSNKLFSTDAAITDLAGLLGMVGAVIGHHIPHPRDIGDSPFHRVALALEKRSRRRCGSRPLLLLVEAAKQAFRPVSI